MLPGQCGGHYATHRTPVRVTQEAGTEPPFNNEFWDHHEAGLYVDVVTGARDRGGEQRRQFRHDQD